MEKIYIDINNNKIDLSKLSLKQLDELNYQEETYFAKQIKKLKPFSKERNKYLNESYEKIMNIADFKRKYTRKTSNGVNNYTIDLVEDIINEVYESKENILFYEAGVGTGQLLKYIVDDKITIKGCDVFLSDVPKQLDKEYKNISLIEKNLYDALDKIEDNSIDIFYADNVLEHIVDDEYEKTCEKICNKIAPNGIAILIIPNSHIGPNDITRIKHPIGAKSIGFHFMEQTFKEVLEEFEKNKLICEDFCFRRRNNSIVMIRNVKFLNTLKKHFEKKLGRIRNTKKRIRKFKRLGYDIYVLRKSR